MDENIENKLALFEDRGYSYLTSGWYEEAIQAYTEILKINPADSDARFFRASAYASLKWTDEAIQELKVILNSDPMDILARHDLSLCYRSLGWKKEALEEMRIAKAYAEIAGDEDEKKIVENSLRNLEGETDDGSDDEPTDILRKLILAIILKRKLERRRKRH